MIRTTNVSGDKHRSGADAGFQDRGGTLFLGVFCVNNHNYMPKNHIFSNCGGRHENFWGISCEKSLIICQEIIFFLIAEGGAKIVGVFCVKNHDFTPKNHILGGVPPPPGSAPADCIGNCKCPTTI